MQKIEYYLDIAEAVARKSTCLRRQYGAIIVKNDEIISTGYNGSPRGCVNCSDVGSCMRDVLGIIKGDAYNLCLSVHAEMNAIVSASRQEMIDSTLYIVGIESKDGNYADPMPCLLCHRLIINAGIKECYGYTGTKERPGIVTLDVSGEKFMHRVYDEYLGVAERSSEIDSARIMQSLKTFPM